MTNKQIREMTILALVRGLPDMLKDKQSQGRLFNLYAKLIKESDRLLGFCSKPNKVDEIILVDYLNRWSISSGWSEKGHHVCTVCVFLIAIVGDYIVKGDKLLNILQSIYDYFDRVGKKNPASDWAGELSYIKFRKVIDDLG